MSLKNIIKRTNRERAFNASLHGIEINLPALDNDLEHPGSKKISDEEIEKLMLQAQERKSQRGR